MFDSQLVHAIANYPYLHTRIEGIVRRRLVTKVVTRTEAALLGILPVSAIAWQVAGNPTIFAAIKAQLDPVAPDVDAAITAGLSDSDLEFVVLGELTCLQE